MCSLMFVLIANLLMGFVAFFFSLETFVCTINLKFIFVIITCHRPKLSDFGFSPTFGKITNREFQSSVFAFSQPRQWNNESIQGRPKSVWSHCDRVCAGRRTPDTRKSNDLIADYLGFSKRNIHTKMEKRVRCAMTIDNEKDENVDEEGKKKVFCSVMAAITLTSVGNLFSTLQNTILLHTQVFFW